MLKAIGSFFLFAGCCAYGFARARKYRERPRQLQKLRMAIQGLETEIQYAATPLPVALMRVSKRLDGPVAELLEQVATEVAQGTDSIQQVFAGEFRKLENRFSLVKDDWEILQYFAATLGISDRKDQLKHLMLASKSLEQLELNAREERGRLERMWNYLGPLLGAMLVVLLY